MGLEEEDKEIASFELYQNHPNPMQGHSEIDLYLPHAGTVHLMITSLQGKTVLHTDRQLEKGLHAFSFHPGGAGLYFFTAYWNGKNRSIQMVSTAPHDATDCRLAYAGMLSREPLMKSAQHFSDFIVRQSGILDNPEENTTYTFQFATNIPCPGTPTVEYEGQLYNTIQIFSQCWLKENLNVGTMILSNEEMTDNALIEKYCYNNEPDSCDRYGGLYQWNEMMQYTTQQGTQGICPPDWHLATDEEWKVLAGAVDSHYTIGNSIWDLLSFRGYDAGKNLKSTSGWVGNNIGTDLFGFSGLPGGACDGNGVFADVGLYGYWCTSTEDDWGGAWGHALNNLSPMVLRGDAEKDTATSVRCIKD